MFTPPLFNNLLQRCALYTVCYIPFRFRSTFCGGMWHSLDSAHRKTHQNHRYTWVDSTNFSAFSHGMRIAYKGYAYQTQAVSFVFFVDGPFCVCFRGTKPTFNQPSATLPGKSRLIQHPELAINEKPSIKDRFQIRNLPIHSQPCYNPRFGCGFCVKTPWKQDETRCALRISRQASGERAGSG